MKSDHSAYRQVSTKVYKKLYIITTTSPSSIQLPEITRIGTLIKNIENVLWIVADSSNKPFIKIHEYLEDSGVPYEYLICKLIFVQSTKLSKCHFNENLIVGEVENSETLVHFIFSSQAFKKKY